ncbi:MAG: hypothetical protein AB7Q42_12920 [Acidimicrobiia bacterium]
MKAVSATGTHWNLRLFDELVAPGMSAFTSAEIPEIASRHPEAEHWLANYTLNALLRGRFRRPTDQYALNALRRISTAYEEYAIASRRTDEYLALRSDTNPAVRVYLSALQHWENVLAAAGQALSTFHLWTGQRPHERDDGTAEQRVNALHNASKHAEGLIRGGQMPKSGPLAVWLTNDGLRSKGQRLSWKELAELLDELGSLADLVQDPRGVTNPSVNSGPDETGS